MFGVENISNKIIFSRVDMDSEGPISKAEVLRQIGSAQELLKTANPKLNDHIYNAMSEISTAWLNNSISQIGGGAEIDQLVKEKFDTSTLSKDISLDKSVTSVKTFLSSVDDVNRQLALSIGPVAMVKDMEDPQIALPYVGPVSISKYSILPTINYILEACRLIVITNNLESPMLRKLLSVIIAMLDVLRGEWKKGILSFIGVFNREAVLIGILGKTALTMYNWISPNIQTKLEEVIYASSKSMFIGSWLHVVSIVAPNFVREKINKIIVLGDFPAHDIQKLQQIFQDKELVCKLRASIESAKEEPPIKLILELLNVPNDLEAYCNGVESDPIIKMPEIKVPEIKLPEIKLPEIKVPEIPTVSDIIKKGGKKPRRFSKHV